MRTVLVGFSLALIALAVSPAQAHYRHHDYHHRNYSEAQPRYESCNCYFGYMGSGPRRVLASDLLLLRRRPMQSELRAPNRLGVVSVAVEVWQLSNVSRDPSRFSNFATD
jgi:hypothetical protein